MDRRLDGARKIECASRQIPVVALARRRSYDVDVVKSLLVYGGGEAFFCAESLFSYGARSFAREALCFAHPLPGGAQELLNMTREGITSFLASADIVPSILENSSSAALLPS